MNDCVRLKQALIENDLDEVLSNPEFTAHYKRCVDCIHLLEAFGEIPRMLDTLTEQQPSAKLQELTLQSAAHSSRMNASRRPRLAAAFAASLVSAAAIGLFMQSGFQDGRGIDRFSMPDTVALEPAAQPPSHPPSPGQVLDQSELDDDLLTVAETAPITGAEGTRGRLGDVANSVIGSSNATNPVAHGEDSDSLARVEITSAKIKRADIESASPVFVIPRSDSPEPEEAPETEIREAQLLALEQRQSTAPEIEKQVAPNSANTGWDQVTFPDQPQDDNTLSNYAGLFGHRASRSIAGAGDLESKKDEVGHPKTLRARDELQNDSPEVDQENSALRKEPPQSLNDLLAGVQGSRRAQDEEREREPLFRSVRENADLINSSSETDSDAFNQGWAKLDVANSSTNDERFAEPPAPLMTGSSTTTEYLLDAYLGDNVPAFQPAQGYWANTYVPGDPAIRLLRARLATWNRDGLPRNGALETQIQPYVQPLDAPTSSALGLSVLSDANAVNGPTRMRLQVGIRAIEQRRGRRPAMNVGIVVDLPDDVDDQQRIKARALLDGLLAARQTGDHFSLAFSGPAGGLALKSEDFRFGPLEVAKRTFLADRQGPSVSLLHAIKAVAQEVARHDNPEQPLGSSAVLLITASGLTDLAALKTYAHSKARDGTTLSVFPLGERPAAPAVEALVLAGLGNRRILDSPSAARNLVEDELRSASRAVARAARLSVRLADGVRLINVVGAPRLDAASAQRVRDIEQSMDQRLSANLGISADRGNDEQGIQIVIPSIFMGDTLTILIDVVAQKPGPIANVSLRYKDLVFSKNGVLHDQAQLPSGELNRGPQELAVLKNLLGKTLIETIEQAAQDLTDNNIGAARERLQQAVRSLSHYRQTQPTWQRDPDLLRDEQVLNDYLQVLSNPNLGQERGALANSLRLAAWRKSHQVEPAEGLE